MISFLGLVGFVFAAAFEPTEAKETIELTKTNIEAADYITVNPTDKWQTNKTYGGITGDFFNMSSGRQMTITVKGVSKFEVFVQNSTAGRKYGVTVGSGNETEITHAGGGVESSGEIETGTSDEVTITLAGKDGSLYPVKIVLTKAENSTEPSLSATPKALEFALTPTNTKAEGTFTLTGKNLTNGEYALEVPNLAGLTVAPMSFTVKDGAVEQQFTVTYESTTDVAKATADITAKVGDLTAAVAVTYQSRATANTQTTVSEAATWDWSQLTETVQLSAETTPKQTDEFLFADLDDRITFTEAFGDAKAIVMKDMQYPSRAGLAQGNIIKFKTSVPGTIAVDFANTGSNRPYRYLYVNGEPTEFKSNTGDKVSATGIEVPAGEIELKGYIPDATDPVSRNGDVVGDAMLRWYKITFTPKAEGGEEPSGETTYPITATWDFQNLNPAALADVNIQGNNEADVASDVDGISMHVISAGGKLQYNASGYAQFNTNTTIQVPVGSTKDIVTVVSYPGQSKYTVGDEDATGQNTFSHTATVAEVTQGYVEITPTATSYIYSIKVVMNEPEESDEPAAGEDVTAQWDFQNLNPAALADVNIQGNNEADVASDVDGISMHVISAGGKLQYNTSGYAQFNTNTTIQVPVKNKGDEITVVSYPGQSNYTVGGEDAAGQNTFTHTATSAEAATGYVEIIPTKTAYIYSISVTQYAPKGATTLDNEKVTATFPFILGTAGQKATFTNADYWISSKVELGSNNSYGGTLTVKDATMTLIAPETQLAEAGETGDIRFIIRPKFGYTFTPTKVSLKASKVGTDNSTLDIAWMNPDKTTASLAKAIKPERNNVNGYSALEYTDFSTAKPGEGACGLIVTLYGLQKGKQLGIADIVIEGTLSGTEKEVPILGSFKINGNEYKVEDVFGDDYEADLKLSKKEKMVSSDNPLADITPVSGELGQVTYEGAETSCKVTIPMTAGEVSLNYVLNITQKPDYTLTYFDVEGNELPNKQTIEEDSKIGEFIYDIAEISSKQNGFKARGWFKQNYVGAKHSVDDVVTSDLKLYAVETEIEVASLSKKYEFDLTDINFDAADHEAFNPTGGKPNVSDMRHGWNFKENDKIELLVGPKANIIITTCQYPTGGTTKIVASNGQEVDAVSTTDGATQAIEYEGEAGTLTLTISGGQCYIHKIVIFNTSETNYDQKGQWIYVKQGDASSLLDAIDAANGMSGTDRIYVYVPNGTYDLGQTTLTTIGRNNISIIGKSMEGTIIKNRPIKEGIAITATLLNTASNTYLQDLTLDCITPYGTGDDTKSAERGVCLQDKGTKTVCKNVYLKGLQDTYYSNGAEGMTAYFENCKIEGTVDFICGSGSVLFNECDLYVADRTQSKTSANVITAPATYASEKGYAFYGCTIDGTDNQKDKYNLGRPWQKSPAATYVNTTMKINASSAGWTSMNKADAIRFHEFNTKNAEGSEVKIHNVNACETSGTKDELYLTEEQAANYAPDKFFTSWTPETVAKQVDAPTDAKLENGTITWTAVSGAAGYAIFANDELLAIVGADVTSYVIENAGASRRAESDTPVYTIRAVNAMGGFGEAKIISDATGISEIKAEEKIDWDNQVVYDLNGRRVKQTSKGVFIINGNKVIIK